MLTASVRFIFRGSKERLSEYSLICSRFIYFPVRSKTFTKKGIIILAVAAPVFILAAGYSTAFLSFLPIASYYTDTGLVSYTLEHGLGIRLFESITNVSVFSALGLISKAALIWYENQVVSKDRERQNLRTELAMLKAQVNPHFLFNTLNNIKSLISSSPENAAHTVRKLKDIMRYMIYDSSGETVPLSSEAGHIGNYLELERIRYADRGFIEYKTEIQDDGAPVPPLIFMPFIENAFKHGNKLGTPPNVIIKLSESDGEVNFSVRNRKKETYAERPRNSGFGLAGIRQRLDLIFGGSYELKIIDGEKTYEVNLKLKLYES
ncbi:MAG: histidine kinase [Bacteroidetes bacterium]|nr:histidine kinase [Bacteroidota bacterium]